MHTVPLSSSEGWATGKEPQEGGWRGAPGSRLLSPQTPARAPNWRQAASSPVGPPVPAQGQAAQEALAKAKTRWSRARGGRRQEAPEEPHRHGGVCPAASSELPASRSGRGSGRGKEALGQRASLPWCPAGPSCPAGPCLLPCYLGDMGNGCPLGGLSAYWGYQSGKKKVPLGGARPGEAQVQPPPAHLLGAPGPKQGGCSRRHAVGCRWGQRVGGGWSGARQGLSGELRGSVGRVGGPVPALAPGGSPPHLPQKPNPGRKSPDLSRTLSPWPGKEVSQRPLERGAGCSQNPGVPVT